MRRSSPSGESGRLTRLCWRRLEFCPSARTSCESTFTDFSQFAMGRCYEQKAPHLASACSNRKYCRTLFVVGGDSFGKFRHGGRTLLTAFSCSLWLPRISTRLDIGNNSSIQEVTQIAWLYVVSLAQLLAHVCAAPSSHKDWLWPDMISQSFILLLVI